MKLFFKIDLKKILNIEIYKFLFIALMTKFIKHLIPKPKIGGIETKLIKIVTISNEIIIP